MTINDLLKGNPQLEGFLSKYPKWLDMDVITFDSFSAMQDEILLRGLHFTNYGAILNKTGGLHIIKLGNIEAAFAVNNRPYFKLLLFKEEPGVPT